MSFMVRSSLLCLNSDSYPDLLWPRNDCLQRPNMCCSGPESKSYTGSRRKQSHLTFFTCVLLKFRHELCSLLRSSSWGARAGNASQTHTHLTLCSVRSQLRRSHGSRKWKRSSDCSNRAFLISFKDHCYCWDDQFVQLTPSRDRFLCSSDVQSRSEHLNGMLVSIQPALPSSVWCSNLWISKTRFIPLSDSSGCSEQKEEWAAEPTCSIPKRLFSFLSIVFTDTVILWRQ